MDRQEPLRDEADWLARSWPSSRVLTVDVHGATSVRDDGVGGLRCETRSGARIATSVPDGAVLLGEQDGTAFWAVPGEPTPSEAGFRADLRSCGAQLDATTAGLLTTAVAVLGWHRTALHCGRDGSPTEAVRGGWARVCRQCGHEEYPRTDPAVICLVHDGGDHVLLARQPVWPAGRYSVLAGFVEAGESLEACVAREVAEEVGVAVRDIRYLGSQPWPFPRSLMVGFEAVADRDAPLHLADGEIEHARWVGRAELRKALAAGGWVNREGAERRGADRADREGCGGADRLLLPGEVSIARAMLDAWAAHESSPAGPRPTG